MQTIVKIDTILPNNRLTCLGQAVLALQKLNHRTDYLTQKDVNKLLQTLVEITCTELGYPNSQIFLYNETLSELEFKCGSGFLLSIPSEQASVRSWRPKVNDEARQGCWGLIGWVGSHQKIANVPDVLQDPRFCTSPGENLTRSELTVPLVYNNELIGVLDIQSTELNAFDELDVEIVTFFAAQAASIVHFARLARLTANSIEDVTRLALVSSSLISNLSIAEIGRLVLDNVLRTVGADSGDILSFDTQSQKLQRLISINLPNDFGMDSVNLSPLVAHVLKHRQTVFVSNIQELEESTTIVEDLKANNIIATSYLPLYVRDEALGVLFINYNQPHLFSSNEKHLMRIFADQVAAALYNARVTASEQNARRVAESLVRSSRLISSRLEPIAVLQTIIDEVVEVLEVPVCCMGLVKEGHEEITMKVMRGAKTEAARVEIKFGQGFIGVVAKTGKTWKEYNLAELAEFANNPVRIAENWLGSIALPIKVGGANGRLIGVLCCHDHVPREFSPSEITYLEGLADQAAIAITNAENYAALKRERDMYHALLENASDPIFVLNSKGNIKDANHRATQTTGYTYNELIGQNVTKLYPTDELAKIQQMFAADQQTTVVEQIKICRKDGSLFPASYSAKSVQIGEERVIIQIVRDMTERRAMEQQLVRSEQLRVLGQLASGVAHDFNNLLTGILGVSELLLNGVADGKEQRLLKMLRQSALDGAEMVSRVQLLGPSNKNAELGQVDLNQLLEDVVELTRPRWKNQAQQKGIVIEIDLQTNPLPLIKGNASELREVVTNLVLNAVDAMPKGGNITIQTSQKNQQAWLSIQDTGTGMSDETKSRLFEPFYTTKAKDGHGLGLSVSNSIIARHNGTIEAESTLNKGTQFLIKLPLAPQVIKEIITPSVSLSPIQSLRILIVDDEPNLLYILSRILETNQHLVTSTTSGKKAVAIFCEQPDKFDLVFTDLGITDLNGWEVARAIKMKQANIPIILVTGWGANLDPKMLEQYEISEVINKPYRLDDVQNAISRTLAK